MAISSSEFLNRYKSGISGAGKKYTDGIDAGDSWEAGYTDPQAQANMQAGLAKAIAEGKPVEGARRIGDSGFKARAKAKVSNYTGSSERAATNINEHVSRILSAGERARAAAKAVPGPKNRATAQAKMIASNNAICDEWGVD